jgi:IclR family acetate operon transcriptional repressor
VALRPTSAVPPPTQPIASVDNALTLLALFREHDRVRIADASKALGVAPSTASRLMAMLHYHGFVTQDPETKAYVSGPGLIDIAFSAMRRMHDHRHVRRHLEQLARQIDETVHYVVLNGDQVVFLDGVESSRAVKTTLRLGERRPAHCVSGGKAILATLPEDEIKRLFPNSRLRRCTEHSVATRGALFEDLAGVRERGYATSIRESEPDIVALAMAVLDGRGEAQGSFAISMPSMRYHDDTIEALLPPLRAAVQAASGVSDPAAD